MSYNKKEHLRANIEAIRTVLTLDREGREATHAERNVMQGYSGFGGLKCVLNPANSLADTGSWAKSELELFPLVAELHRVIRDNTSSEREYRRYVNSIKNSVLTAFYTPKPVTDALMDVLEAGGIRPSRFLEPSAGTGTFLSSFKETMLPADITAFEKDLLTGKILSHLHPNDKIRIEGYEKMDGRYNGHFDVVASNIPFGDVAVFDPQLSRHGIPAVRQSTKTIHNYFFTKSVQAVREGGIIAFITSQGVLNSEQNKPVREYLMNTCDLVSAVRLPNNLFSDNAGTDVGSDLIILQKNTENRENRKLDQRQQDFIESRKLSNGISINNLFRDFDRVVQTGSKIATDPYGKPAIVFTYEGSTKELAESMRTMLYEDFARHYNHRLYLQHERDIPKQAQEQDIRQERKSTAQLDWEENSLGWEDVLDDEQLKEAGLSIEQQSQSLGESYQPTQEDYGSFGEYVAESDEQFLNERPPQSEDYNNELTLEDIAEIDEAVKASKQGKWEQFVAQRPYMRANTVNIPKPDEKPQGEAKKEAVNYQATAISPSLGGGQGEVALSLYDLFGFSQEERSQVNTRKKKRTASASNTRQPDLFSQPRDTVSSGNGSKSKDATHQKSVQEDYQSLKEKHPGALLLIHEGDCYKAAGRDVVLIAQILGLSTFKDGENVQVSFPSHDLDTNLSLLVKAGQRVAIAEAPEIRAPFSEKGKQSLPFGEVGGANSFETRPYSGELFEFHKRGSLVEDKGQIGFLKERYRDGAEFQPLDLPFEQRAKIGRYIEVRDTYHALYNYEATEQKENASLRAGLNFTYDTFINHYGFLNDKKNLDVIKMDAGGREMLSLEKPPQSPEGGNSVRRSVGEANKPPLGQGC